MITMSTLGNDGDLRARSLGTAGSNATRVVTAGGENPGADARVSNIDYVTIATTGNAQDFGDQTEARTDAVAMPSATRCSIGRSTPIELTLLSHQKEMRYFGDCTARDELFRNVNAKEVYNGNITHR